MYIGRDMDEKKEVDPERVAAVAVLAKLAIRKLSTTTAHDLGYREKTMEWANEILRSEANALALEVNTEVARLQMLALTSLIEK